jgi:hypothetical protein
VLLFILRFFVPSLLSPRLSLFQLTKTRVRFNTGHHSAFHWTVVGTQELDLVHLGFQERFDFESDVENNSPAFFDVDVSLSGDENLLSDLFVAGRAASWMSNLRFSSEGDGRFSSVGSIEVNLSPMSLSLTGFQDARPGDGTAVLFDVQGFLVPEPPLSWIALVTLALPFLRRPSGRIGRVIWPNSGARTRNSH